MWLAWTVSWLVAAVWSAKTVARPGVGRQALNRIVTVLGIVLLFGFYRRLPDLALWRLGRALAWFTVGFAAMGLLFTWWARVHIGRLWSGTITRKAEHHIVETGPYALVRHPIYSGLILAVIATGVQRGTLLAMLGAALVAFSFVVRARLEEQFLREQLGAQDYDAYARRVPMLVPFTRS